MLARVLPPRVEEEPTVESEEGEEGEEGEEWLLEEGQEATGEGQEEQSDSE